MKVKMSVKAGQVTIVGDVNQSNTSTVNQTNSISG
jgi:hypothetical protein